MIKLLYPSFWSKKGIISFCLIPLSWIYIVLGIIRKIFTTPIIFQGKVICIGNASVGGTGKTQLVSWLARELIKQNIKCIIVTKAYKGTLHKAKLVEAQDSAILIGDESKLLSASAPVIATKHVKYIPSILKSLQYDLLIFDDGLQNPGFIKDYSVMVIDSMRAIGNAQILPSGPLRESVNKTIAKSNLIMMIGNQECNNFRLISNIVSSNKPFFRAKIQIKSKVDMSKKYHAFTAIGNPDKFYSLLKDNDINVVKTTSFPDHHTYDISEITKLKNIAQANHCTLITTHKDYTKLNNDPQILPIDIDLQINDKNAFIQNILHILEPV